MLKWRYRITEWILLLKIQTLLYIERIQGRKTVWKRKLSIEKNGDEEKVKLLIS